MDLNDKIWNPWHGCQNCYAYFLDRRYGKDTNEAVKNRSDIDLPVKKDWAGFYKLESGSYVHMRMVSDFFWREMIPDVLMRGSSFTAARM